MGLVRIKPAPKTISATPPSMNSVSLSLKLPLPFSIARLLLLRRMFTASNHVWSRSWIRPVSVQDSVYQRCHQLDCLIHGGLDRRAQSHLAFLASKSFRFTADQQNVLYFDVHRFSHAQHVHRIHGVGFNRGRSSIGTVQRFQIGLDDVERARCLAMRTRIHQNDGFVAVLQGVGKIEAADAEVGYSHARGKVKASYTAGDFDAKGVVAQKDVTDARHQNGGLLRGFEFAGFIFRQRFDFFGVEEEAMPRLPQQAHISTGIIIENHADMTLAFVILLDAFDGGNLPRQCNVHHVAALAWTQSHPASAPHFDSRNLQMIKRHLFFQQLPLPLVHRVSSLSGRSPRKTPCSFMNCFAGMFSVRSSMARARSSEWLISRFSSSVKVMMRRERISSISVPSNKSPALSGAIWG